MRRSAPPGATGPTSKAPRNGRIGSATAPSPSGSSSATVVTDLCNFSQHLCRREKLAGYELCLRHILEDPNAPFKQCNFHYRSQRRCPRPAPKSDKKDGFCLEHARKALLARQQVLSGQAGHGDQTQHWLQALSHYKREDVIKSETGAAPGDFISPTKFGGLRDLENDIPQLKVQPTRPTPAVQPLPPPAPVTLQPPAAAPPVDDHQLLSGDEEFPGSVVESAFQGDADSDAESVDSELDNPLKYSGIYTSEEVVRIMRDKLIRLQKLYIDQFQRLRYVLREERRGYRMSLKKEQEAEIVPIHSQTRESLDEITAYDEAKAMCHYNKPQGLEAVLFAEQVEKRQRLSEFFPSTTPNLNFGNVVTPGMGGIGGTISGSASGAASASASLGTSSGTSAAAKSKCSFNLTSSTKCGEICIPLAKFCIKHILQDTTQVLFRPCGVSASTRPEEGCLDEDGPCETPIPDLFETSSCVYHTNFLLPTTASSAAISSCTKAGEEQTEKHETSVNEEIIANGLILP